MDRDSTTPIEARGSWSRGPADEFILPTRGAAKAAIRAALLAQDGPVLLTGEPGTGKTWLCRRLIDELPFAWRWLSIDLTPADGPAEFQRSVAYGLGLAGPNDPGTTRLRIADYLQEVAADGIRWVLIIDEAQNLSAAVMEEVRVLTNRLGAADGFAGLLLAGHTSLRRRLAIRPWHAIDSRLAARLHLRPLDLDEARGLLSRVYANRAIDAESLQLIHRDAAGNPRALIRLAGAWSVLPVDSIPLRPAARFEVSPPPQIPATIETARPAPVLAASKPPIRVEDGLIEVGWTPASEPDVAPEGLDTTEPTDSPAPSGPDGEELIDDHYAALQAWNEWARNQGRDPAEAPAFDPASPPTNEPNATATDLPLASGHGSVWVEGEQSFAPYSQLFSRLRQKGSR